MSQESQITPPPIIWAQRANIVYVTVCLEDCKDPIIEIGPEKIYFKGVGGTDHKMHEITINLYKPINHEKTLQSPKERVYEIVVTKKEEGPYWPRLTKEDKKFHWLKSDFNKWRDEDDSEDEGVTPSPDLEMNHDYSQMLRDLGGAFGGTGNSKPNFDELDDGCDEAGSPDSDDDDLPDLE